MLLQIVLSICSGPKKHQFAAKYFHLKHFLFWFCNFFATEAKNCWKFKYKCLVITSRVLFFLLVLLLKIAIDRKCHLLSDFFRASITIFFEQNSHPELSSSSDVTAKECTTLCIMDSDKLNIIWWFDSRFERFSPVSQVPQKYFLLQKWLKSNHLFSFTKVKPNSLTHTVG